MLYKINNVTVSLGGNEILSHISFEIHGTEKIAITGINGAGKTTLLKYIAGELEAQRDDKRQGAAVETSRALSIAMLHQTDVADKQLTVREICERNKSGADEWEFDRLLTGFGLEKKDKDRRLEEFSGGEQTKISLISLLLEAPDILLLDEPTNHLDMKTVEWLEEYLKGYEKAVVFISHDRFFMDRVAEVVYEVDRKNVVRYPGNYTAYRAQKLKKLEQQTKEWERNEREKKRLEELILRFKNKPTKAAFARSRKTMLERLPKLERPAENLSHIFIKDIIPKEQGAKWVVDAEHLKCGYGGETVVELSMKLQRGSKVAIIGDNGAGKSTFLKTLAGIIKPIDGKCTIGNRIEIGYFDQMSADINSPLSVYEHFRESFPGMNERELKNTLASFLFRGALAHRRVCDLSGGEKARLVLAELLTQSPNFLILDEPTNHMDITAKETLESAFKAYRGTILLVSHDRYLVSQIADSLYFFEDGHAFYYPFGYENYLERLERLKTARRIDVNTGIPSLKGGTPEVGSVHDAIMGMVSSEDEAIIVGLKAVPKKERHEIGFKSTEEAHEDWQRRLAEEALEAARVRVESAESLEAYEEALAALTAAEEEWYRYNTEDE